MFRRLLLSAALALCTGPLIGAAPSLLLSPAEWKFGMIIQGSVAEQDLTVTNLDAASVTVTLVPTCTCNTATPSTRTIAPGARGVFHMRYDSTDDRGITVKSFLVRTDPASGPRYYYLRGVVREQRASPSASGPGAGQEPGGPAAAAASSAPIVLTYYYSPGCRSCEEFLSVEIPRIETIIGWRIEVVKKDVMSPRAYEELAAAASARGQSVNALPALLAGETLLQGDAVIREKLTPVLLAMRAAPAAGPAAPSTAIPQGPAPASGGAPALDRHLATLSVVAAGLIDGINPCAFTTLIFLLASLALAGRGRAEVLVIGALFSAAVFASYFLIGLGFFTALRAVSAISVVSVLLRWVLVAALVVFAGLSLYDFTLIRSGRAAEMVLQLPTSFKKRIHASIRTGVRTAALAGSSFVMGVLVSVFEFACTGQVYLPTLGYLARLPGQPRALGLLALYNLCFIAPLLLVFGATWWGVTSGRVTAVFQAHMGTVKLALAVVFLGLAALTLAG